MDYRQLRIAIIMEVLFQQYEIDMGEQNVPVMLARKGAAVAASTVNSGAYNLLHAYLDSGRTSPPLHYRSQWSFLPTNRPN